MDRNAFVMQEFISLRREIEGQQMRLFWIVVIGLLGLPLLSYFLISASSRTGIILPFFVLVLIVLFLTQQSQMMRAGRYIREFVEKDVDFMPGWESWLESRPELRLMDRHFSACFIVIFFAYYFLSIALALHLLWSEAAADASGTYQYYFYGAAGAYAITTIWALATLLQHWKLAMSTSFKAKQP